MKQGKKYVVNKTLNNNVILAFDNLSKDELVLVGKGIGFGKKQGQIIELEEKDIEKLFLAFDENRKKEYYELINQLNNKVIGLSEEIIAMAEKEFGQLNSHIHIALTDHISFAIDRIKSGLEISNPFIYETKALYPEEFEIAEKAALMIKDQLEVDISESEIGFIALHIHAARQNIKVTETINDTRFIKELVDLIESELVISIDNTGLTYSRLINHLRTSVNRMENQRNIKNPLLSTIKDEFKESYQIAKSIGSYIEQRKNINVSEDELGYLALHIERIKETAKCVTE